MPVTINVDVHQSIEDYSGYLMIFEIRSIEYKKSTYLEYKGEKCHKLLEIQGND